MPTIPLVSYLVLDEDEPHLRTTDCTACGARFLGDRVACSSCGGRSFRPGRAARTGVVGSFSIVHRTLPGVVTPFASVLVDLDDGVTVKANLVGCPPDTDHVRCGQRVELTTLPVGTDAEGTEAVSFAFTPVEEETP